MSYTPVTPMQPTSPSVGPSNKEPRKTKRQRAKSNAKEGSDQSADPSAAPSFSQLSSVARTAVSPGESLEDSAAKLVKQMLNSADDSDLLKNVPFKTLSEKVTSDRMRYLVQGIEKVMKGLFRLTRSIAYNQVKNMIVSDFKRKEITQEQKVALLDILKKYHEGQKKRFLSDWAPPATATVITLGTLASMVVTALAGVLTIAHVGIILGGMLLVLLIYAIVSFVKAKKELVAFKEKSYACLQQAPSPEEAATAPGIELIDLSKKSLAPTTSSHSKPKLTGSKKPSKVGPKLARAIIEEQTPNPVSSSVPKEEESLSASDQDKKEGAHSLRLVPPLDESKVEELAQNAEGDSTTLEVKGHPKVLTLDVSESSEVTIKLGGQSRKYTIVIP